MLGVRSNQTSDGQSRRKCRARKYCPDSNRTFPEFVVRSPSRIECRRSQETASLARMMSTAPTTSNLWNQISTVEAASHQRVCPWLQNVPARLAFPSS